MTDTTGPAVRSAWSDLILLWLAGVGLRLTILAVPPVLPLIHRDLNLSEKEIGVLSALPALLLGLAAIPGSLTTARLGAHRSCLLGLTLVAFAGGLYFFREANGWRKLPAVIGILVGIVLTLLG